MINGQKMRDGVLRANLILKQVAVESVPLEILQLHALILGDKPNVAEIVKVISHNPEVMATFLSLVNKVLNRPEDNLVYNVTSAVHLLGLDEIHQLFVSAYVIKIIPVTEADTKIVRRSLRVGIAVAELSHWVYGFSRSESFLISFVQDIGALYLKRYDPNYIEQYFDEQRRFPLTKFIDEEKHYKTSHCFIGGILAKRWNLGSLLYRSVLFHHHADLLELEQHDARLGKMVALIRVGHFLEYELYSEQHVTKELEDYYEQGCEYLKLTPQMIHAAESALKRWGDADVLPDSSYKF